MPPVSRLLGPALLGIAVVGHATAGECSTQITNSKCTITVDRRDLVVPPQIQMRAGATATIVVANPSPLEDVSIDNGGTKLVNGPDPGQAALSALISTVGKGFAFASFNLFASKIPDILGEDAEASKIRTEQKNIRKDLEKYMDGLRGVNVDLMKILSPPPTTPPPPEKGKPAPPELTQDAWAQPKKDSHGKVKASPLFDAWKTAFLCKLMGASPNNATCKDRGVAVDLQLADPESLKASLLLPADDGKQKDDAKQQNNAKQQNEATQQSDA